jgi:Carboxypeptidase regulatory-like domain
MRSRSLHFLCVLLTVVTTTLSFGQSATTSLRGTITDTRSAVLTGASVTISNAATGFSRTVKSDDQGVYQFLEVPPASYTVTVNASGFAVTKHENVLLQVSNPATLNFSLQVQGGSEIVDVTGEAPMVNTQDATLGNNFDSRQLTDLPSEGRDPVSILSLQPGVVYIGTQVNRDDDSRSGSVNGARSDQTNVTLDGLDDNDQLNGYAFTGAMRATLDSLQEFRVTTSNYDAASGRSSGAQVNLVTKSGTNSFHGSVYEYHRPTIGVANDWFNKQAELKSGLPNIPQHILRNTFGGTIGGPIKKDRLFFFAAYEGQRTADQVQVSRVVPSASMKAGQLKYLCNTSDPNCFVGNNVSGPNGQVLSVASNATYAPDLVATLYPAGITQIDQTRTDSQGNVIETGCADLGTCPWGPGPNPNILSMFSGYPNPNGTSGGGDGLNSGSITFPGNDPVKHDTYIFKLDYKITPNGNHSLFVRGNLQNDHESQPPQYPGLPPNNFITDNSKGIAAGYTALLTNTFVNNFRYAFIRQGLGNSGLNDQPFNRLRGLDDVVGLTPIILTNVPVHNFIDDVSWTKGHHTIQFGTNWRLIHNNRQSNAQNLSEGYSNLYWMSPSFIANEGTSLDPSIGPNYPLVDDSFGTSYSFAAMQLMGIMSQTYTTVNQDKNAAVVPSGALVQRHFRNFEGEMYLQDKWNVTPNLTVTAGLRYSLLQPPYEADGNQVSPTVNMHQWFTNRWKGMLGGNVVQPDLTFDLSGQGNGRKPYWAWNYKNLAPRFALAYSPHAASGLLHTLFGDVGKSSIRAGYGLYFDHFGEGVVNTFDRQGSWGLTTTISNPAGVNTVDSSPRFTGLLGSSNLPPSPGAPIPHGFPYTPSVDPNTYGLAIAWGIDDNLKTPYSHIVDLSLTRELPHNFVVEATYTGRFARHLLQEIDLSQPLDLVDPGSKTSYFGAAQTFDKAIYAGVSENDPSVNLPYWNNLFPQAGGAAGASGCAPNAPANPTPSQNIYDLYYCNVGNETLSLEDLDAFCLPACAGTGSNNLGGYVGSAGTPFQYYQPQFSSLYGWQTRGNSSYNGLQLTLRHAMSSGLQFDFNYTYSKSIDVGSNAERINGFESGGIAYNNQVINAFQPNLWRAVSDFDATHQFNANFIWDLPFGHGRHWGSSAHGIANAIFGGWSVSGLYRLTTGFPFSVFAGNGWSTNFELNGTSFIEGARPKTDVFRDQDGDPNVFQNAINLTCTCFPGDGFNKTFRATYAGEAGQRNVFRGPGYFGIDGGLAKTWNFKEDKLVRFSWEVFNVTNSVRFDAAGSLPNQDLVDITGFGKLNAELTSPRVMQFSLRFAF